MLSPPMQILQVGQDGQIYQTLTDFLEGHPGFSLARAASLDDAHRHLESSEVDILLFCAQPPGNDELKTIAKLRQIYPHLPLVVLTIAEQIEWSLAALQEGVQETLVLEHLTSLGLRRALRFACERQQMAQALQASETRYRTIFETAAVPIWEEDFSAVMAALAELKQGGVDDFSAYFEAHPGFVQQAMTMVRVTDVNRAALTLFQAQNKDELIGSVNKILLPETLDFFRQELLAIAAGAHHFSGRTVNQTLSGERLSLDVSLTIPALGGDYQHVLVSMFDLTGLEQAQAELAHSAQTFAALYETTRDLAGELDLAELLEKIVDRARQLLGTGYGGIYLYDASSQQLELRVAKNLQIPMGTRLSLGEGMAGKVAQTRKPLAVEDYAHWEGRALKYQGLPFSSVLEVPMLYAGELVGVLVVNEVVPHKRSFSQTDIDLLSLFASHAAGVVRSVRLLAETRHQLRELQALGRLSAALGTADELDGMIRTVLDEIASVLDAPIGAVFMRDRESGVLVAHGYNPPAAHLHGLQHAPGEGLRGYVAVTDQLVVSDDIFTDERFKMLPDEEEHLAGLRFTASLPLKAGGEVVGVLHVARKTEQRFDDDDLQLLRAMAHMAASAIRRTLLRADLEHQSRDLRQQNERIDRLYRFSKVLLAGPEEDLGDLSQRIVRSVAQEYSGTRVSLLYSLRLSGGSRLLAVTGPGDESALTDEDQSGLHTVRRRAFAEDSLVEFRGDDLPAVYTQIWPEVRSVSFFPLRSGEQVAAYLELLSSEVDTLSHDEQRVLEVFAETAGLTLERARLFEITSRQLERILALHEIDRAITSSVDLHLTMKILLDQVCHQLDVAAATVLLFNRYSQMLEYVGQRGFSPGEEPSGILSISEGLAGQCLRERRVVHLGALADPPQEQVAQLRLAAHGFQDYYALPLIAKGRVNGVMEVYLRQLSPSDPEWLKFLETLATQAAIAIDNQQMFDQLNKVSIELRLAYDTTLEAWSRAMEIHAGEPLGHTLQLAELAVDLGRALELPQDDLQYLRWGALLHDVGILAIPNTVLLKNAPLTEDEWQIIRRHPETARRLLSPIRHFERSLDISYCHHERWDGSGYPRGLAGERIPLAARIFAVVDVWDALTSPRPHRPPWTQSQALETIQSQAGKLFDPRVVTAFIILVTDLPQSSF